MTDKEKIEQLKEQVSKLELQLIEAKKQNDDLLDAIEKTKLKLNSILKSYKIL